MPADRPRVRPNAVKRRIAAGEIALGTWVGLADPALVEIIGVAGFDAASINLEHASYDLDLVRQMIVAADAAQIAPIVRIPAGSWDLALRVLDAGAQGIQVSRVPDAETARQAVDATRYAPIGRRGALGHSRAARFGAIPWEEYSRAANEEVLLIIMLEDREALEHAEEIAAVDGVDLVMVGAADLSESLGLAPNDPGLRTAVEDVARRINAVGHARMGFTLGHPFLTLSAHELRAMGVAYSNVSPHPEVLLRKALTESVAQIRASWASED
jgi:4-hydroxy-2-oxoheptanedioate aldolase